MQLAKTNTALFVQLTSCPIPDADSADRMLVAVLAYGTEYCTVDCRCALLASDRAM